MHQSIYQIKKREELKIRALKLYRQGLTMEEIAAKVGKSRQWVGLAIHQKLGKLVSKVIK